MLMMAIFIIVPKVPYNSIFSLSLEKTISVPHLFVPVISMLYIIVEYYVEKRGNVKDS